MTVDALRRYFRNLSEILESGKGGKSVLDDLDAIDRGLSHFADMPLKSFAEFLEKAQSFDPAAVVGKKTVRAAAPKLEIAGIVATVKHIYETAGQPDTTIESIDEGLKVLDKLTIPNLIVVAQGIRADSGLTGKKKAEVLGIIKKAVRGMWDSAHRVQQ